MLQMSDASDIYLMMIIHHQKLAGVGNRYGVIRAQLWKCVWGGEVFLSYSRAAQHRWMLLHCLVSMTLERKNILTPRWETNHCGAASLLEYMMHQHRGGSCVTTSAFPSPLFMSRVTWPSDTDQEMERSRGKFGDFWPNQVVLWVQLVEWAQGKGMRCLSNWNTFFSSFHFQLERKSPTATKFVVMGRYSVQCVLPVLGNCLLWSRSPKALMGKCPPGRGAQERHGVRSFICGCINGVLNKKDLMVVKV